jgi:hypothetical protein
MKHPLSQGCRGFLIGSVVIGAITAATGCVSYEGQSARAAKEATDPPYAKGTYGTPSDPAWPFDAPYRGGGGGHR